MKKIYERVGYLCQNDLWKPQQLQHAEMVKLMEGKFLVKITLFWRKCRLFLSFFNEKRERVDFDVIGLGFKIWNSDDTSFFRFLLLYIHSFMSWSATTVSNVQKYFWMCGITVLLDIENSSFLFLVVMFWYGCCNFLVLFCDGSFCMIFLVDCHGNIACNVKNRKTSHIISCFVNFDVDVKICWLLWPNQAWPYQLSYSIFERQSLLIHNGGQSFSSYSCA